MNTGSPPPGQSPRFSITPQDPDTRRRLARLARGCFALLALHFALVYTFPDYLRIPARGIFRDAPRHGPHETFHPGAFHPARDKDPIEHRGSKAWLWGGEDPAQDFDVTERRFDPAGLHYGLGREAFPALIEPAHVPVAEADWVRGEDPVLVASVNGQSRIYPVQQLIRHEVVNDRIGGVPIFAAYCILAELGAVYDRRYGDHELTFGVSGYTYAEPAVWEGKDAFVLWDRETESLWWPPIGRAVAGPLLGTSLKLLDESRWSQTTFKAARQAFPGARVLARAQSHEPPEDWPHLTRAELFPGQESATTRPATQPLTRAAGAQDEEVAPARWGDHTQLPESP